MTVESALSSRSVKLNELLQLKPPILIGVLKLDVVLRESFARRTLSRIPAALVMNLKGNSLAASLLMI